MGNLFDKRLNVNIFFQYLILAFMILRTNTVFSVEYESRFKFFINIGLYVSLSILVISSFIKLYLKRISVIPIFSRLFLYYIILFPLVIINLCQHTLSKDFILLFGVLPLLFIFLMYQKYLGNDQEFLIVFTNLVKLLAIISLIIWLMGSILHVLLPNGSVTILWGGLKNVSSYHNIYFEYQRTSAFGLNIFRNIGIFAEAPMFSFILSLALCIRIILLEESVSKNALLIITILSTQSLTGIIIIIMCIMAKCFSRNGQENLLFNTFRYVLIPLVIIGGIFFIAFLVRDKQSYDYASYGIRLNDIQAGYLSWMQHPFWGNGINNYSALTTFMNQNRLTLYGNSGFSSGLMRILSEGGVYFGLFFILPLFNFIVKEVKLQSIKYIFPICILIILSLTIIDDSPILIAILTWLVTENAHFYNKKEIKKVK